MNSKILLKLLIVFGSLLGFHLSDYSQDSFEEILSKGEGSVVVNYRLNDQFVLENGTSISGIEPEILELFFKWISEQHNIDLTISYQEASSFTGLYDLIKNDSTKVGNFGICSFSITPERLGEVQFSPAYMPDVDILVSSSDIPNAKKQDELKLVLSNSTALIVPGTTFEEDLRQLSPFLTSYSVDSIASSDECLERVINEKGKFSFVELPSYYAKYEAGEKITRQNSFFVKRDGYAIILPKNSDWNKPIWEFFQDEENQRSIRAIIKKYFGAALIDFLDELKNSSEEDGQLMLLANEKEIERLKVEKESLAIENLQIENQRQEEQREARSKLQMVVIISLCVFAVMILFAYRLKIKDNQLIQLEKLETERQKKIVEEKHEQITDSIHYAKTIQNAMLQGEEYVNSELPDHFVFFSPKDVVSGDFYWSKRIGDYCYFTAADCTGHGVPGGFMSMLGIALLNDILADHDLLTPAEICEKLRARVIKELDQSDREGSSLDGMDISLCRLNVQTLELDWCGAYNPLYIYRKDELIEIKADKQPIAFYSYAKPFTNHKIQCQKGDMIYSATDGFPDQFGGPKGKKLKSSGFKRLLKEAQVLSTSEQKKYLSRAFDSWKGDTEQVDDTCVVGLRV